jgi:hypothetical protein
MTSEASTTTWETLVEQYRERAARDDARIEELRQSTEHWHDTAQMLKRQRDMAEQERDAWKVRAMESEKQRDQAEKERDALRKECNEALEMLSFTGETSLWQAAAAANQEVGYFRAERDALRKDAARLDWLADTVAIEAFGTDDVEAHAGCVGMDVYEHASIVAEERGNDDDFSASDMREGFRRMIDAAIEATP